jgi:site-specific DNA-methyltransferase (adenine-specific)
MITVGDILKWSKEYDGPLFHSAFLDPPYHLGSITDRFGKPGSAPPKDGVFARTASGFMGQDWDSGDIAFRPETWDAIKKHLHPGSFNFAFAGTRGYHRMACAIEDAGFIIHPMIIWANKQGFPKAQRVDTQIDQAAGEKVKKGKSFNYKGAAGGTHREHENWDERTRVQHDAITPQAKQWEGHRYGLQALRPMLEPICVFQKPFPEKKKAKPYESIVNTGAGALNIDGAWIQTGEGYTRDNSVGQNGTFNASGGKVESEGGHWPANMIIDDEYAAELDEHTADQFYVASQIYEQIEDADPVVFAAKASISEKEAGLDSMQRRIMVGEDDFEDGRLNDGRQADSERPYLRNKVMRRNIHATVKPIALTRHLATLLLPPEGYDRRLLVPFSGVGSEMIGAMLAGWDYIQGIELVPLHAKIARVRLNYWVQWRGMPDLKPKIIRDKKQSNDPSVPSVEQTTLF